MLVDPSTLGSLERTNLAAAMRPLWEDAGPLVERMVGVAVAGWGEHIDRAERAIAAMDDSTRAQLLNAHPRIGAPTAALAARSATSLAEQGGASADPEVMTRLSAANDAYEARMGFPFVEWVAGRSRAAIADVLDRRLERDRPTELAAGCSALVAIARDRLATITAAPGGGGGAGRGCHRPPLR